MVLNLSEATDIVEGMQHTCLRTNEARGNICEQRAHFLMTSIENFECVNRTCPVLIDFLSILDSRTAAAKREKEGRRFTLERIHSSTLFVLYLQQILQKLHFLAIWEP